MWTLNLKINDLLRDTSTFVVGVISGEIISHPIAMQTCIMICPHHAIFSPKAIARSSLF